MREKITLQAKASARRILFPVPDRCEKNRIEWKIFIENLLKHVSHPEIQEQ